ncbi:NAD(P)-binding protein [Bradyrhizobium sp. CCGUVB23]|uniref:NAD(P)-binding protein n=1 Tax=Bradyrhizobium sp. CCGUVB23 TaxID=2949630 RepID=UPI0020B2F2F0|nr:NAD(P)-binding protein [Bradyrhizobium sp. CCGUVB23]MCP3460579.1 FAD-dependent oxidoreductase [Bradyrhizobium sp. CCGUVB23]
MITRRDFLAGTGLAIVAGIAPIDFLRAQQFSPYYPPSLTGLRGSHPGSFEAAHALGREGKGFQVAQTPAEETYDLVIVGGGISGLSAAWFYRQKHGADKSILILENHDDFGGHAKRNEFTVSGRLIIGYGGTETIDSPRTGYSEVAAGLLKSLGIDLDRFTAAFDRTFYASRNLSRGVFFNREHWGEDKLVTGDPFWMARDDQLPNRLNARPLKAFIADFPLAEANKAALVAFHEAPIDYLKGMALDAKEKILARTSYRDYLIKHAGLSERAAQYFQGRFNDLFASSSDTVSALAAMNTGFPGFDGLGMNTERATDKDADDPYICHFPDGNASIARLLVRSLIPGAAPGTTMDDIVLARFDYSRLDEATSPVRIRLNSIAVNVRNFDDHADVSYVKGGALRKVRGRKCILAGYNMMIPFLCPELPEEQRLALRKNVKMPLIYTNVVVRTWKPFLELGIHELYAPTGTYARVKMDFPVNLGGYEHPKDPSETMCVHMYCAPTTPNQGLDARNQSRLGRQRLLETPFDKLEHDVRDQLSRQLAGSSFDESRDIQGITVNRWPHGYAYSPNSLFDDPNEMAHTMTVARRPFGNVAIAHSDSGWEPLTQAAINQAWRAVGEIG